MPEVSDNTDSTIARHLARGYAWMEMIESGKVASIAELSKHLDIDKNCVTRDLRLLSLAHVAAEGRESFPESGRQGVNVIAMNRTVAG